MIQRSTSWKQSLIQAISRPDELCATLGLADVWAKQAASAANDFRLLVPREFVARMVYGDIHDPLLRQVLPIAEETMAVQGFSADPLAELTNNPQPGLLHKYHGRVLLILAGACAINCRYCFRRHFPYQQNIIGSRQRERIINYLQQDETIEEVIYSGGEPLLLDDKQLAALTQEIASIPHIKRLRIHTRLPIVIPARVNQALLRWLTETRLQVIMVVHCNHAQEIDAQVASAFGELQRCGVMLLNQSVLLKGVNDSAEALIGLSQALVRHHVSPYYLHLLDPVAGAAHFQVSKQQAIALVQQMQARLSGFMVPKLVCEIAGESSKTVIA